MVPASLLGITSPLCMYGTIPIAASFSEKGMRDDWLAAFMMSSILLNPQLLIYSAALGRTALVIRFVSCFICAVLAGLCVRFFYQNKNFFNFSGFAEPTNRDTDPNMLLRLLKNTWRNVNATGGYFLPFKLLREAVGARDDVNGGKVELRHFSEAYKRNRGTWPGAGLPGAAGRAQRGWMF